MPAKRSVRRVLGADWTGGAVKGSSMSGAENEDGATRFADRRRPPLRQRIGVVVTVAAIHVLAILALLKGLAAAGVIKDPFEPFQAVTVTLAPSPSPMPSDSGDEAAGKAAPEAPKAKPKEVAAPKTRIPVKKPAPPAASTGSENQSGAGSVGTGSGAGGIGTGTGSGGSGTGSGAGAARAAEKIAGDINSIRDYPRQGREARIGHAVTIEMTVGTDGRARGCRVVTSSGDPEADSITCHLAEQRFRFRPRLDAAGRPAEALYRWRQRFFIP